ncbi:MAG: hypothetical protein HY722_00085 [Planctomycetes bacterium]|nr:hypothetical protein [Planctomycetota bacterium]
MGERVDAHCPGCGREGTAPAEWAGRVVRCKHCRGRIVIGGGGGVGAAGTGGAAEAPLAPREPRRTGDGRRRVPRVRSRAGATRPVELESREKEMLDAVYRAGHRPGLREVLGRALERGGELLLGKPGYVVGQGTRFILLGAGRQGVEALQALTAAVEAERRTKGKVNPVKETLAYGYTVARGEVGFGGKAVARLREPACREGDLVHLRTRGPIPRLAELRKRFRGLDPGQPHVAMALMTLDFQRGAQVRVRILGEGFPPESEVYFVHEMDVDARSGAHDYVLVSTGALEAEGAGASDGG